MGGKTKKPLKAWAIVDSEGEIWANPCYGLFVYADKRQAKEELKYRFFNFQVKLARVFISFAKKKARRGKRK